MSERLVQSQPICKQSSFFPWLDPVQVNAPRGSRKLVGLRWFPRCVRWTSAVQRLAGLAPHQSNVSCHYASYQPATFFLLEANRARNSTHSYPSRTLCLSRDTKDGFLDQGKPYFATIINLRNHLQSVNKRLQWSVASGSLKPSGLWRSKCNHYENWAKVRLVVMFTLYCKPKRSLPPVGFFTFSVKSAHHPFYILAQKFEVVSTKGSRCQKTCSKIPFCLFEKWSYYRKMGPLHQH